MQTTSNNHFDVIVAGVGSMGSAACYYLASRGLKVLGLEQFDITHDNGSHAGQSRLIRKAYFEHPGYVPLLERAYDNWKHLEDISGEKVYYETGIFYAGSSSHPVIKGVHDSAGKYNIPLNALSRDEVEKCYSPFDIPNHYETFIEPLAGFLTPEKAIVCYVEKARELGAIIKTNAMVIGWKRSSDAVTVVTTGEIFTAKKIVISSGAFTGKLLPQYHQLLTVTRQTIAWVVPKEEYQFALGNFPCWMIADDDMPGVLYGFPVLPRQKFGRPYGLKLAHHYAGNEVDADIVDRDINEMDVRHILNIMDKYFKSAYQSIELIKTCLYTNTPDEDFIVDFLPGSNNNIVIAAGFSGHGFKFASVVGEILADLIISQETDLPIEFLGIGRFTLKNKSSL